MIPLRPQPALHCLYLTYEELKLKRGNIISDQKRRLYLTYEELKLSTTSG